MILLDTHIWVWWADNDPQLPVPYREAIENSADGVGISVISCWEIAKKIEKESRKHAAARTLSLSLPVQDWIDAALKLHGVTLIPLSPQIILESTNLPGGYNLIDTDPGDQLIIATARVEDLPLMTLDGKIASYAHVRLWKPSIP